jgi:serine/threonine protein kinase
MTIRSDAPVALDSKNNNSSNNDHVEGQARARIGEVLGERWRLDEVLGIGGMAIVYLATHNRNGAHVAIKLPRGKDPTLLSRFVKEGWIGNRVDHSGVVKTLDDGITSDGLPFLVMERLIGETLDQRVEREGRLSVSEVVRIISQVCDVLAAAHDAGIVHRDVKPSNVFLVSAHEAAQQQGSVKLLDFGIAREIVRSDDGRGGSASGIHGSETIAGVVVGTPGFLSPEQAMGGRESIGPRSDIWAAGALAFALLTETTVHSGETPMEKVAQAMIDAPPVRMLAPEIPSPIAAVLDRALAYDIEARFASAREMRDALSSAMISISIMSADASSSSEKHPRSRLRMLVACSAVVGAWILVGGAVTMAIKDEGPHAKQGEGLVMSTPVSEPTPIPPPPPPAFAPAASVPSAATSVDRDRNRDARTKESPRVRRAPTQRTDPMNGRF